MLADAVDELLGQLFSVDVDADVDVYPNVCVCAPVRVCLRAISIQDRRSGTKENNFLMDSIIVNYKKNAFSITFRFGHVDRSYEWMWNAAENWEERRRKKQPPTSEHVIFWLNFNYILDSMGSGHPNTPKMTRLLASWWIAGAGATSTRDQY